MRYALSTVLVVVGISAHLLSQSPRELDEATRLRVVKYGLAATQLAGMSSSHVVDFIEAKTGADRQDIIDRLNKIRGRLDRDGDSLVAERVGVIVANADAVRVRDAIVAGLCKPLADEGDAVALAACQSRQTASGVRLCRVSNGAQVAYGTRIPLTSWRVVDVRAELLALAPAPNVVVVRDDTQAKWNDALANNVPALRVCNDGE